MLYKTPQLDVSRPLYVARTFNGQSKKLKYGEVFDPAAEGVTTEQLEQLYRYRFLTHDKPVEPEVRETPKHSRRLMKRLAEEHLQVAKTSASNLPRGVFEPLKKAEAEPDKKEKQDAAPRYSIQKKGVKWYDVLDSKTGKPVNEKSVTKAKAGEILETLLKAEAEEAARNAEQGQQVDLEEVIALKAAQANSGEELQIDL